MSRLALAAAFLLAPTVAAAQNITFTGSGTFASAPSNVPALAGFMAGAFTFSATLPQSPTPTYVYGQSGFYLSPLTFTFYQGLAQAPLSGTFTAYASSGLGGFNFYTGSATLFNTSGPQIFTGPTSAPTFQPGTYVMTSNFGQATVNSFSIAPATTTAPEPSTWALVGAGVVVSGAAARRRRTTTA